MATKTILTAREYAALEEPAGVRYELSNGKLIVTPSPTYVHNVIRDRMNALLRAVVEPRKLGGVVSEMDFRLVGETVGGPMWPSFERDGLQGSTLRKCPCRWLRIS